jgi:hypothetical protein
VRTVVGIAGFVLGVTLALLLLLLNPVVLTHPRPATPVGSVRSLGWGSTASGGMALRPLALLGMNAADGQFADPGIRHTRVEVAADSNGSGAAPALVVRLTGLARGNSLLRAELGTVTHTNIVWPGRGSVFLSGSENFWAPLRAGFWSALRGQGFRPAADRYVLPPMPGAAGSAASVTGATGEYATARGNYRETFLPDSARPGDFAARRAVEFATE